MNADLPKLARKRQLSARLRQRPWLKALSTTVPQQYLNELLHSLNAQVQEVCSNLPYDPERVDRGKRLRWIAAAMLLLALAAYAFTGRIVPQLDGPQFVAFNVLKVALLLGGAILAFVGHRWIHGPNLPAHLTAVEVDEARMRLRLLHEEGRPVASLWTPVVVYLLLTLDVAVLLAHALPKWLPDSPASTHYLLAGIFAILLAKLILQMAWYYARALRIGQIKLDHDHCTKGGSVEQASAREMQKTYGALIPRFPVNPTWWDRNAVACGWLLLLTVFAGGLCLLRWLDLPDEYQIVVVVAATMFGSIMLAVRSSLLSEGLTDKVNQDKRIAAKFANGMQFEKAQGTARNAVLVEVHTAAGHMRADLVPRIHGERLDLRFEPLGEHALGSSVQVPAAMPVAQTVAFRPVAPSQVEHASAANGMDTDVSAQRPAAPFRPVPRAGVR